MSELIRIESSVIGTQTVSSVSAKELHERLGIRRGFTAWIRQYTESVDWTENIDFAVFSFYGENPHGGRPSIDYALSIRMAEHIAMLTRTDAGTAVREFFRRMRDERNAMMHDQPMGELQILQRAVAHLVRIDEEQKRQSIQIAENAARIMAIESRQPPQGKTTVHDWLRRFSKPHLPSTILKYLKAECKRIEDPERFRPDGCDYPLLYYAPETIERAYAIATKQISFIEESGVRYGRRKRF